MGNENLTPAQVHRLHRFAQVLARNVMNRRGVLKNELRRGRAYAGLRAGADLASRVAGRVLFTSGSAALKLTLRGAKRGAATQSAPRRAAAKSST
jgi:hypothetical protein